jgi:hypothetical protein
MGRAEQVSSPPAPGAGRIRDVNFPDYDTAGAGASNVGLRPRDAGTGVLLGQSNNLGGLSTTNNLYFQGIDGGTENAGGGAPGTGGSLSWFNIVNVRVRTVAPPFWPIDDDWNVHRVVWIAAMSIQPTSLNDVGLQFVTSNTQTDGILRTPQNGFGIQYNLTGVSFMANNGGGAVQTQLATNGVAGFLSSDYHSFDIRLLSALPNQHARLKVFMDDTLVVSRDWTDGTLPVPVGAITGFFPALWNNATGGGGMVTRLLSFQAAPTELMVL